MVIWGVCWRMGLLGVTCAGINVSAAQGMKAPAVELRAEDYAGRPNVRLPVIRVPDAEYQVDLRGGEMSVGVSLIVAQDGSVESTTTWYGPEKYLAKAQDLVMAQTFKPFELDGKSVRARITETVLILPEERWAETKVPFPEVKGPGKVRITLARKAEMSGVSYTLAITGQGMVSFNGGPGEMVPGMHVAHIQPAAVKSLVEEFRNANYFSLLDAYTLPGFDALLSTVTIDLDGKTKRVVDYMGFLAGMPEAAKNLEQRVDDVAGTARWTEGSEQTLAALVSEDWDFGAETPVNFAIFSNAVQRKDAALVDRFMAAKAPVATAVGKRNSPLIEASKMDDVALVKRMAATLTTIPDPLLSDCLAAAARSGSLRMVQFWLDRGADPVKPVPPHEVRDEMSILGSAVASGHADVVQKVLEWGVDVNAPARVGDPDGEMLIWALQNGRPKQIAGVLTALLKAGANVNSTQGGQYATPVVFNACRLPEAFKPLIAAGANINGRYGKNTAGVSDQLTGYSLLMSCAGIYPAVQELLADGADPTVIAGDGNTALTVAKKRNCDECATLIEAALQQRAANGAARAATP